MKIVREETLLSYGQYASSAEWQKTRASLYTAIREVDWPRGTGKFTIYPELGKERGKGNGVTPIKLGLMEELYRQGWKLEQGLEGWKLADEDTLVEESNESIGKPGKLDAVLSTDYGPVALEWETGNISSSHRALNKMALGLLKGVLACGILVVPSRELYKYLTDRIGNMAELEPYLDLWRSIPCKEGVLEIVAIEHDATSTEVPRIPKNTARVVKAEVTALWHEHASGTAFRAALAERGYLLCKGEGRTFSIIDAVGEEHKLAKRLEGVKAAEIRTRMTDIDRDALPTVAEGRAKHAL